MSAPSPTAVIQNLNTLPSLLVLPATSPKFFIRLTGDVEIATSSSPPSISGTNSYAKSTDTLRAELNKVAGTTNPDEQVRNDDIIPRIMSFILGLSIVIMMQKFSLRLGGTADKQENTTRYQITSDNIGTSIGRRLAHHNPCAHQELKTDVLKSRESPECFS